MICIPLGRNLMKTLCYNLVPYPDCEMMKQDSAIWERAPKILPLNNPKRDATGYADLYTWQSRMIRLEERPSGNIATIRFVAGEGIDDIQKVLDPMQAYRLGKPVPFRVDRATWRYFDSILPSPTSPEEQAPKTLQMALELAKGSAANLPRSILVLGLRYTPPNANVEFWRMEQFALPAALAGSYRIREDIRRFLDIAENSQKALWLACSIFARNVITRGERIPDGKDIKNFLAQMPCIPAYWASLERNFHTMLQAYTLAKDLNIIELNWVIAVRESLSDAWNQHRSTAIQGNAWTIRALVNAEWAVASEIRKLGASIKELKELLPDVSYTEIRCVLADRTLTKQ